MQDVKMSDLTPEEKARPYSKYFYKPLTPAAPERVAAMDRPIDPSLALLAENRSDLLNPGDLPCEAGWCVLPDGTGFIANRLPLPGVTAEMVEWWFAWHALEPLRYKIWNPPCHFGISLSEKDRAKALDASRPMRERYQGLTHFVIENCGGPCAEKIAIEFMTPEEFGFDMERFKAPNVLAFAGGKGASVMLAPPPGIPSFKAPAIMCHLIRAIPGGVELRTRFWMGMRIIDRKAVRCIPDTIHIPEFIVKGLAVHNVGEFANLASFLPQIYEEQKGLVEA